MAGGVTDEIRFDISDNNEGVTVIDVFTVAVVPVPESSRRHLGKLVVSGQSTRLSPLEFKGE